MNTEKCYYTSQGEVKCNNTVENFAVSTNGRCGYWFGGTTCPKGQCCSEWSWCDGNHNNWSWWCPYKAVVKGHKPSSFNYNVSPQPLTQTITPPPLTENITPPKQTKFTYWHGQSNGLFDG